MRRSNLIVRILYLGSYSLFLGFYASFYLFFWPHISGLLTLRWPFGQYVLCLYVTACTSMPLLVDELNK